ncbi:hypothetical protein AVEN_32516-1 [Araneus ventricosus]|uniref:Tc1-like transposase DDE domain-containing protein n=1 Tax=Araneus ventricosus TaxID=182803 RepID=A0A4Y2G9D5_ARAVE|nr:hypothetical protein AVEN_32516-1 [Araneus ventricosus]
MNSQLESYRNAILDPYVRLYAGAISVGLRLMADNAGLHRVTFVHEYTEEQSLKRMERPTRSLDLNPIEHLWDYQKKQQLFKVLILKLYMS